MASPSTATASTQRPAAEASRTEPYPSPSFPANCTSQALLASHSVPPASSASAARPPGPPGPPGLFRVSPSWRHVACRGRARSRPSPTRYGCGRWARPRRGSARSGSLRHRRSRSGGGRLRPTTSPACAATRVRRICSARPRRRWPRPGRTMTGSALGSRGGQARERRPLLGCRRGAGLPAGHGLVPGVDGRSGPPRPDPRGHARAPRRLPRRRAQPATCGRQTPDEKGSLKPRRGVVLTADTTVTWSLWTASNRLLPRTKGTLCQMSYRGASCPPWPRTRNLRNQNPALCRFELMGIGCGRCDSNAHAARFELARSTGCHHSRMVRREGLEPPAIGLRVHCSSI